MADDRPGGENFAVNQDRQITAPVLMLVQTMTSRASSCGQQQCCRLRPVWTSPWNREWLASTSKHAPKSHVPAASGTSVSKGNASQFQP